MHRSTTSTITRSFRLGISSLALLGIVGLSACSSDDDDSAAPIAAATDGTAAAEDIKVDPAVVTTGLIKLPGTIASAIAAIGTPEAEAKLEAIEEEWAGFEGTVRDTDPDIYLAIEDQLDPVQDQIKAGDTAAATATAATLAGLFTQYLTAYPA